MPNWKPFAIGLMVVVVAAAIGSVGASWNATAQEGTGPGGTGPEPTVEPPTVGLPTEPPTQEPPSPTPVPTVIVIPPTETPVPTPDVQATEIAKVLHQVTQIRGEVNAYQNGNIVTLNNLVELNRLIMEDIAKLQTAEGNNQQQVVDILNSWSVLFDEWHTNGNSQLDVIATAIANPTSAPPSSGSTIIEDCYKCFSP